jgi:hypothetical protein
MDQRSHAGARRRGLEFEAGYQAILKMGEGMTLSYLQGMSVASRLLERRRTWELKNGMGPYLDLKDGHLYDSKDGTPLITGDGDPVQNEEGEGP